MRKIKNHVEHQVREVEAVLEPALRATLKRKRREVVISGADGRVASSIQGAQDKPARPHHAPELQSSGARVPNTWHGGSKTPGIFARGMRSQNESRQSRDILSMRTCGFVLPEERK